MQLNLAMNDSRKRWLLERMEEMPFEGGRDLRILNC
jgi:hypothetical protein